MLLYNEASGVYQRGYILVYTVFLVMLSLTSRMGI